jgi:leucyl aminopeptidase (aminopeptidase T)
MTRLQRAVRTILVTCLNLKAHETLVIVTEEPLAEVGETLWKCAKRLTKNSVLIKYVNCNRTRYGLSSLIQNSLVGADCVVVITSKVVTPRAFQETLSNGARLVLLSNSSIDVIERSVEADYKKLTQTSRRLADIFSIGRTIHVTSPSGTDITVPIKNLKGTSETGLAKARGDFVSLPAGGAFILPGKKSIQGQIVIDRIAGGKKPLSKPVVLKIQKGHITQIKGGREAEQLRKDIRKFGENGRRITKLGIGTNTALSFGHSSQEDENVYGAAYVSIGQNLVTRVHQKITQPIKAILLQPTVVLDGKIILRSGDIVA